MVNLTYDEAIAQVNSEKPESIIRAAAKQFSKVLFNDEYCKLEALARTLKIDISVLKHHFGNRSNLLIEVLNYIERICQENVFDEIESSRHRGLRRVIHFHQLIHSLLYEYPECAYWFKAYFISDVVLTPVYPYLMKFYERWRSNIENILKEVVSNERAEKIAVIYVETLKASLISTDGYGAIAELFPAKIFLFDATKRSLNNESD